MSNQALNPIRGLVGRHRSGERSSRNDDRPTYLGKVFRWVKPAARVLHKAQGLLEEGAPFPPLPRRSSCGHLFEKLGPPMEFQERDASPIPGLSQPRQSLLKQLVEPGLLDVGGNSVALVFFPEAVAPYVRAGPLKPQEQLTGPRVVIGRHGTSLARVPARAAGSWQLEAAASGCA